MHSEHIEIIRSHVCAEHLHRLAHVREKKASAGILRDARKHILTVAIMPELRHGKRELLQVAFFCLAINTHDVRGLIKRQRAQKKIMNQAEDSRVHADPESERDYSERSEPGRFAELAQSETEVVHRQ